jgi:hypothetical protein
MPGACASRYHPWDGKAGFQETLLGEKVYAISFAGNQRTTPAHAACFALHRAAEISREKGASHFTLRSGESETLTTVKLYNECSGAVYTREYERPIARLIVQLVPEGGVPQSDRAIAVESFLSKEGRFYQQNSCPELETLLPPAEPTK